MLNKVKPEFEQIIEDNKYKIYRICKIYAIAPIEPEDLFQEVTIHIWKALTTFDGRSGISTWIYRIALNVCMRYKNKLENSNVRIIRLESIQFEPLESAPDSSQQEKTKALYSCIQTLNEKDQAIIILVLEGLPYKEIGRITGLTENHIAVKMKRVRKILSGCITSKLSSNG